MRKKNEKIDINDTDKKARPRRLSKNALRQGGFVIALTAIVLAGVIVINVIATTLYNKYPLDLDFTADKQFTITAENEEYIKNIDKQITIYALAEESAYVDKLYYSLYYDGVSGSVDSYAAQAYEFLLKYAKLNPNIKIEFVDPDQPEFQNLQNQFSDVADSINYCDLIVTSTFEADGKEISRHKLISSSDFFSIESDSYGYSYSITGSNLESVLTSALYTVTSERTFYVGVITSHNTVAVDNLTSLMESSNYVSEEISNIMTTDIDSKYDIIILSAPTQDFSAAEVERIDKFLKNDGKYGKSLFYIASSSQTKLPNLEEFLYEWGFTFKTGTLYETNDGYHLTNRNTEVLTFAETNDYVNVSSAYGYYVSDYNKPIIAEDPNSANYTVNKIAGFNPTTVIYPQDAGDNWSPENGETGDFSRAAVSTYLTYEGTDQIKSNVLVVASTDFINNETVSYGSVYNLSLMLGVANSFVGAEQSISFEEKVINNDTFSPTDANVNVIRWIFAIIIPIVVIGTGIYVFIRRKNL